MISITKLNNKEMVINAQLIESIESTPDTNITMTTGRKFIAKESVDEIIDRVIAYNRKCYLKTIETGNANTANMYTPDALKPTDKI